MPRKTPTAEELRNVARYLEETAAAITTARSDNPPPLTIGDAQNFPRERPEDRLVGQGGAVQEATNQAVDAGVEVSPVQLATVRPYLEAYRDAHR